MEWTVYANNNVLAVTFTFIFSPDFRPLGLLAVPLSWMYEVFWIQYVRYKVSHFTEDWTQLLLTLFYVHWYGIFFRSALPLWMKIWSRCLVRIVFCCLLCFGSELQTKWLGLVLHLHIQVSYCIISALSLYVIEIQSLIQQGKVSFSAKALLLCGQLSLDTVPQRLAEAGFIYIFICINCSFKNK